MTDYKKIERQGYECRLDDMTKAMFIKKLSETAFIEATYDKDKDGWRLMLFIQDNPGSKNAPLFSGVYQCSAYSFINVESEMQRHLSADFPHLVTAFTSLRSLLYSILM